jgi:hypothetical protein
MKLRIHGDSLRIRVTKTDLSRLQTDGRISEALHVAPNNVFAYALVLTEGREVDASFEAAVLSVYLPKRLAASWYRDTEVSLAGVRTLPGGGKLDILIEKDFTCLVPRPGEDQSDYFANPAKTSANSASDA